MIVYAYKCYKVEAKSIDAVYHTLGPTAQENGRLYCKPIMVKNNKYISPYNFHYKSNVKFFSWYKL